MVVALLLLGKFTVMDVFHNGTMTTPDRASVPVDDAGFQHAVGLFETMSAYHGRVFRMERHLGRLAGSAAALGLARDLDIEDLARAVRTTIRHNRIDRARIRLTVTPGSVSLLHGSSRGSSETPAPSVLVTATEPIDYDPSSFDQGIMTLIAPPAANPFDSLAGHKTLSYWGRLRTLRQAAAAGGGEAIWLNVSNHLASGAVSNLFLIRDGAIMTPIARGEEPDSTLPAPVLPGITRAAVMEIAEGLDLPVRRQMLSVTDLLDADEVFLTNSSWLVLPVTMVEKKPIGNGAVGPLTQRLRGQLLELIEQECEV